MKKTVVLFLTVFAFSCGAQIFHFDTDSTAIIKNTNQSPAHWYLEILNDAGVDTTLRWKAHFSGVPAQWNVNFDDQNSFYNPVADGDSADFTLYSGLSLPQKLIIGVEFNNTLGTASIHFDIYDPETPQDITRITYHYIVGQAGINTNEPSIGLKQVGEMLYFDEALVGGELQVIHLDGRISDYRIISNTMHVPDLDRNYILRISKGDKLYVIRQQVLQ